MRVSVGGGAPIRLARAISSRAIAVDADNVYFADVTGVTSVPIGGGKPTMLFAGLTSAQGLAVDSRYVYWTDSAAGTVMRVPRTGGTATIVATGELTAAGIAADGERVVWAVSQPGSIETVPLSGGLPVNLASAQSAPQQVALDPFNAYWTNSGGTTPGSVLEVPLAGGPAITLATGQTDAVGIAAAPVQGAGTYVFWVNRAAGQLMAAPAIGGFPPIELASGLGRPERVAVGTDSLYWTDNSSGNVMELACAREGEPRAAGSDAPPDGASDAEPTDSSLDDATIEDEANDIPGILNPTSPPPPVPPPPNIFFMLCPVDAGAPLCNDLEPTCMGAPVIQQGEARAPPANIWTGVLSSRGGTISSWTSSTRRRTTANPRSPRSPRRPRSLRPARRPDPSRSPRRCRRPASTAA